jgi:hypothetical protein
MMMVGARRDVLLERGLNAHSRFGAYLEASSAVRRSA